MIAQLALFGHEIVFPIMSELATGQAVPLLHRLEPRQRVRAMAGLIVVLTFGGFLLLFIRASGRFARWYIHRPERLTRLPGDPLASARDPASSLDEDRIAPPPSNRETPWDE